MPNKPDKVLILAAKAGDNEALSEVITAYSAFVGLRAKAFCCSFCEEDDLQQEGMLALLSAVRSFDPGKGATFRTYLGECVDNRMISFLRRCARQNRVKLGELSSVKPVERVIDPESVVIGIENRDDILRAVTDCLSDYEKSVLALYVEGLTYRDMSAKLGTSEKSIGNALCRVKAKLSHRLNS